MAITVNNSANITYKYGTQTDKALSNVATTELSESYSLSAEKITNNTNWRPSENITFSIKVFNNGAEPLFGVAIQDNLGGNANNPLTYLEGSIKMFRNNTFTNVTPTSSNPLTFSIPDTLESGEVVTFTYVAKVRGDIEDEISNIVNEITVVGHENSLSGPTIMVTPNPTVTISKADYAEVRIEKSVNKENVFVNEELIYTFRLENSGNMIANDIVINDDLPTNFVINSITSETNGVLTTFDATDYSLDTNNKLILPTSTTKTISVPAKTSTGNGVTTVTITGTITA